MHLRNPYALVRRLCVLLLVCLWLISAHSVAWCDDSNVDKLDAQGFSLLHRAAMKGDVTAIEALLEENADVEVQQGTYKGAPLQYAAARGHLDAMRLLIEAEADLNAVDTAGRTPLMWAAMKGQSEAAALLIASKCDLTLVSLNGWTPVDFAIDKEHAATAEMLINVGIKQTRQPPEKKEPIPWDLANDINRLNERGFSALHDAVMQNKPLRVVELLSMGADVNVRQGTYEGTPLQYAASGGHREVVQLLIQAKANLDLHDTHGRTPMMWAAQKRQAAVVSQLIKAGADVNATAKGGWTALRYARQAEDTLSAEMLIAAGAKDGMEDKNATQTHDAAHALSDVHAMYQSPQPFISPKSLHWQDIRPTELDVNVRVPGQTHRHGNNVTLSITIDNAIGKPIQSALTHEWHGGLWPPTDLYASVTPVGSDKMAAFAPVYLNGETDGSSKPKSLNAGKHSDVVLRMDWPGTGSVHGSPLMSEKRGSSYLVAVMLVFEVDGNTQYTVSKLTKVMLASAKKEASNDSSQAVSPISPKEVARRKKIYNEQLLFLELPETHLPTGFSKIPQLPVVVLPGASPADDAYFRLVSAFVGGIEKVGGKADAALIAGWTGGEGQETSEIGVYALHFEDEADAKALARAGLVQKGNLLMYFWQDEVGAEALKRVRNHFEQKPLIPKP